MLLVKQPQRYDWHVGSLLHTERSDRRMNRRRGLLTLTAACPIRAGGVPMGVEVREPAVSDAASTPARPEVPEPGRVVEVRGATWAVAEVRPQGLPRSPADEGRPGAQHVVTLQSLDEDRLGEDLDRDLGAGGRPHRRPRPGPAGDRLRGRVRRPQHAGRVRRRGALGSGHLGRRRRHTRRRSAAASTSRPTSSSRCAGRSTSPRTNLLLADDVGPGQDHRGRPGGPGAAAAPPRPHGRSSSARRACR